MKRDIIVYIEDIMDCINDIESFIKNKTKNQFFKNAMMQAAVIRKIEVIGED